MVLQLRPGVNGMRSHRMVMNRLIMSEMLDWMTGALEEMWFAAMTSNKSYLKAKLHICDYD